MFDAFLTADGLIALVTLTFLEVVLGVDNVIFISILSGKLPADRSRRKARRVGLLAAMGMRILLLFSIAWIIRLTAPLFTVFGQEISGPRSDPDRRRPVPAGQGDARDSRAARRRRGARLGAGRAVVRRGDRSDHAARHRVLARLGDHRRGHGRRSVDHGGRRRHRGRRS